MEFAVRGSKIKVNVPSWAGLEVRVANRLARRKGFALATLNLDHLVKMRDSKPFRDAYAAQDFIVADGNPIVWMARLARKPVELIPGSEAILPLARIAARQGVHVALVGSTDKTLDGAKTYLERQVPGIRVTLCIAPPMGFDASSDAARGIFDQLNDARIGMCFVALGAPKQEMFAAAGRRLSPDVGFASIGAGLDFFSGAQRRAPLWARRFAVEWLWRLLSDPSRLGPRYAKCLAILPSQLMRAVRNRSGSGAKKA